MHKTMRITGTILALVLSLSIVSCTSKVKKLNDKIKIYNKTMQWGLLTSAAPLIDEPSRKDLIEERVKFLNGKNIVDSALVDLSINKKDKNATAIVQYSYIEERTQNLKIFNEIQLWKEIKGNWYLSKIIGAKKTKKPTHLD